MCKILYSHNLVVYVKILRGKNYNMKKNIIQKRKHEMKTVLLMIYLFCRGKHGSDRKMLCRECEELATYVEQRIKNCPHMETKTFCSSCETHCYKPEMRERIRDVMRYSGPRMILYHPIMAVKHLIDTLNAKGRSKKSYKRKR